MAEQPIHSGGVSDSDSDSESEEIQCHYEYKIGDRCEIKYDNVWRLGIVVDVLNDAKGKRVQVQYKAKKIKRKKVPFDSIYLRKFHFKNHPNKKVDCICMHPLQCQLAKECYPATEERPTAGTVSCDMNGCDIAPDEYCYHCPQGKSEIHTHGYDLCTDCAFSVDFEELGIRGIIEPKEAKGELKEEKLDAKEIKEAEEHMPPDTIAFQLGKKHFAKGSNRYAFHAQYTSGEKKGQPCVIKKYIKQHVYTDALWNGDILCSTLADTLVTEWNRVGPVKKKYEVIIPQICRKGDITMKAILLLLALENPELFPLLEGVMKDKQDEVAVGEVVIIEDYIRGKFEKWNSNSGWMCDDDSTSVQAFCHWTYHQSGGEYLFCDAQGVRRADKYILTDPCIVSREGRKYGVTDVGKDFMFNWFRNHECRRYCKEHWLRPSQEELDSVPDDVRSSTSKNTSLVLTLTRTRQQSAPTVKTTLEQVPETKQTAEEEVLPNNSEEMKMYRPPKPDKVAANPRVAKPYVPPKRERDERKRSRSNCKVQ